MSDETSEKPEGFQPPEAVSQADADETHPGFQITCRNCGSTAVIVDSSLGFSATSGGWGSVDLRCGQCGAYTEIVKSG